MRVYTDVSGLLAIDGILARYLDRKIGSIPIPPLTCPAFVILI